jgi:hypothetical protein
MGRASKVLLEIPAQADTIYDHNEGLEELA